MVKNSFDKFTIDRMETKKINKLGTGYIVFVSKEVRELGWDAKTKVKIAIVNDGNDESAIIIRKTK